MSEILPTEPPVVGNGDPVAKAAAETFAQSTITEDEPFHLSFEEYNQKECLVDTMNQENATIALRLLKNVGVHYTDQAHFLLNCPTETRIDYVKNDGGYTDLFKGLREDFKDSVYEIIFDKKEKDIQVRIFFTTLGPERMFYVIAIRGKGHYDTSKSHKKSPRDFRDRPRRRFR